MSLFSEDTDIVLGGVDFVRSDNLEKVIRKYSAARFRPWMLRFGVMPPHPGAYIKRKVFDEVGFFDKDYSIAADFDFFVKLFLPFKYTVNKTDNTFVRMRIGGISTSGFKSKTIITQEMLLSLRKNGVRSNRLLLYGRLFLKLRQFLRL